MGSGTTRTVSSAIVSSPHATCTVRATPATSSSSSIGRPPSRHCAWPSVRQPQRAALPRGAGRRRRITTRGGLTAAAGWPRFARPGALRVRRQRQGNGNGDGSRRTEHGAHRGAPPRTPLGPQAPDPVARRLTASQRLAAPRRATFLPQPGSRPLDPVCVRPLARGDPAVLADGFMRRQDGARSVR